MKQHYIVQVKTVQGWETVYSGDCPGTSWAEFRIAWRWGGYDAVRRLIA